MLAQQKQEDDNGDEFVVWNVDGTSCSLTDILYIVAPAVFTTLVNQYWYSEHWYLNILYIQLFLNNGELDFANQL